MASGSPFEFDVWITRDGAMEYLVWLTLVGEHPLRHPTGFIVGEFRTFDEAVAAILAHFPGRLVSCELGMEASA